MKNDVVTFQNEQLHQLISPNCHHDDVGFGETECHDAKVERSMKSFTRGVANRQIEDAYVYYTFAYLSRGRKNTNCNIQTSCQPCVMVRDTCHLIQTFGTMIVVTLVIVMPESHE